MVLCHRTACLAYGLPSLSPLAESAKEMLHQAVYLIKSDVLVYRTSCERFDSGRLGEIIEVGEVIVDNLRPENA